MKLFFRRILWEIKYFFSPKIWILYQRSFTIEFAFDFRQWALGGNCYSYQVTWDASTVNIFLLCFRLGFFRTGIQRLQYPKLFG